MGEGVQELWMKYWFWNTWLGLIQSIPSKCPPYSVITNNILYLLWFHSSHRWLEDADLVSLNSTQIFFIKQHLRNHVIMINGYLLLTRELNWSLEPFVFTSKGVGLQTKNMPLVIFKADSCLSQYLQPGLTRDFPNLITFWPGCSTAHLPVVMVSQWWFTNKEICMIKHDFRGEANIADDRRQLLSWLVALNRKTNRKRNMNDIQAQKKDKCRIGSLKSQLGCV